MGYDPKTITELISGGIEKNVAGVMVATKRDGKWIETSPEEFSRKVKHFALGLYDLGVREGDRVSLHAENCAEWLICDQAILSLGAADVPIYTTQPGDQIKYILENAEVKVHIVSDDELFAGTKSLMKSIESVEAVISLFGSQHQKLRTMESVLERGRRKDREEPGLYDELRARIKPDDLATLIYTSGTTGDPKGVMLSHNNIASNLLACMERVPFEADPRPDERMLSYLPLSHVFERLISYMYLYMGYPVYYIEDVDEISEDLAHVEPKFVATVPRLLEKMYTRVKVRGQEFSGLKKRLYYWALNRAEQYDPEHPPSGLDGLLHRVADKLIYSQIRQRFGEHMLGFISGGAALSPSIFSFVNALGLYCGQGYGLTESSPVISVTDPDHMRIGSSGRPLSNMEVKIADDGEILARGPNIMMGYFRNPERTRENVTEDGWLMTGDVGKLEDSYLFITDRKKSVFKLSTGKFVAPQTVENRLAGSGFIEQSVVIGYQRKFCSALIVPNYENVKRRLGRRGVTIEEPRSEDPHVRELIQQEVEKVNRELSPWETVKKFTLLQEPLTIEDGELTPTLKVKRTVINERYHTEIDSMYQDEQETEQEEE